MKKIKNPGQIDTNRAKHELNYEIDLKPELKREGQTDIRDKSIDEIQFHKLFDLGDLQKLQQEFADATGVASVITHVDGTPITVPSNFTRLCEGIIRKTDKGRHNCYQSDAVIGAYNPEGPIIKQCLSGGLWDAGAAITVGGKHVANWLIGQVRDENVHSDKLLSYAHEIGADEDDMVKAFNEVPRMSAVQFKKIAKFLYTIANQLSNLAFQNYQLNQIIRENNEKHQQILYLSYHDYLTGMYNRRFYEESLERLDQLENLPLALLLGDVNGLKYLNDTVGHAAGDELLIKIADIIRENCQENYVTARLGGDEFAIVIPLAQQQEVETVIAGILKSAKNKSVMGIPLSISFGYAIKEHESDSFDNVFKRAEDQMYLHKSREKFNQIISGMEKGENAD
ncbi:PocR ligand-binding domain-containing protein [Eubacteriaceae bacterium ES2]|nr:PocR ligand-binding domain-containing protein [Eubacteriaceae bacterium ES2]